jgi:hypothetical protein
MKIFDLSFDTWKTIYANHSGSWSLYEVPQGSGMKELWTGNRDFLYKVFIDAEHYEEYSGSFSNVATIVDKSDDAQALIITGISNIPEITTTEGMKVSLFSHKQGDQAIKVAQVGREGTEIIRVSHDYSKPYTWFEDSVRVTGEILSQSNPNLFWCQHQNIINLTHGFVYDEERDIQREPLGHGYHVKVFSGSYELKQNPIYEDDWVEGGEYKIDYISGSIITSASYEPSDLTVDYSYSSGSCWYLRPEPGQFISLENAEVQFGEDIVMNDTVSMETWGYVGYFAPHLAQSNGGPLPDNMKIMLGSKRYKRFSQFIDDSKGSFPSIPITGGEKRGTKTPIYEFPFNYQVKRTLLHSLGMEIRVRLEKDRAMGGNFATATFYTVVGSESELQ